MTGLSRTALLTLLLQASALSSAWAGDWEPDTTRILGDPSFLPLAGQVEGSFGYTYRNDRYDTQAEPASPFFPAGASRSYKRDSNDFLPTLSFGITDDISVFASLGWANSRNQEDYTYQRVVLGLPLHFVTTRARVNFHAIGATDPDFGATWRFLDQANAPVSLDLTGAYSPDIFQARSTNRLATGSEAAGGQSGTVQLAISREMKRLTARAYGGFGYAGRRNEVAAGGLEDLRSAPHAIYTAGFQTETRVLSWLALNAGVTAQQAVRYDRPAIEGNVVTPFTIEPSGSISPYVGLLVPLLDRHLVGELLYQHDFIDNAKQIGLFETQRQDHQQSNLYTARVLFAFGGAPALLPASVPAAPASQPAPSAPMARTYLVFFDWDRADLTARARQIVAEAALASTQVRTTQIEVNGYTDLSGGIAYNQRLSVRRAESVEAELVRDGVARNVISIQGFGENHPLIPTAAGVREPQNRRVEILVN